MKRYSKAIRAAAGCLLLSAVCAAQQTAAPTPETVGPSQGETWGDYSFNSSFETGYRFETVGGNDAEYRSAVNFGNGVKLLGSSVAMNSKDGHGRWFDEILFSTQGLGGDPYESATFRLQKNRWYRYDLLWCRNDYFNPGLTTDGATGAHLLDTEYNSQNHDLTILPQSKIQFFLGYTRDGQSGTGLTTVPAFDAATVFPVFANVRRLRSEYRVGNEIRLHGFRLTWTRGWEDFKDDGGSPLAGIDGAPIPSGGATLSSFSRTEPYHGTSPYWRAGLFYERGWFSINGRFSYTAGQRGYLLDESTLGFNLSGAAANRQVATFGTAQRPVATANLTVSAQPASKLTIVNQTSTYNVRTEGNSAYAEFDNSTQTVQYAYFEYLGIFTFANQTTVNYHASHWLSFHGGYQYTDRRIRSIQQTIFAGAPRPAYEQTNILNSGFGGVRMILLKGLTLTADGEVGLANHPFAPKSDQSYHTLAGQLRYQYKTLRLSAASHADYNTNSTAFTAFSSQSRVNTGSAYWAPLAWMSLDASYSKLHLNTVGGIAYFAGPQLVSGQSYYISNIHSGNFGLRLALKKLATAYLGYSIVQDTGDGRGNPLGSGAGSTLPALEAAQTYPMRFQSPLARLSFRLSEKARVNLGYQRYGFRDDFHSQQDYRSDTGYVSLMWSF
ncbi:MAG: hypothetical protein ABSC23_06775 [Bryobacteraceae bacterium]|jgi:hypothetical protein